MREELLVKCSEYLNQVIEEIRMLSRSLTPPGLNLLSLVDSVEDLIQAISDAKNIYIELDSSEFKEKDVPLNKQLTIYRIVQEQLNNVLKHSNADRVRIELRSMQKVVSLKIIDNGIGFDINKTKPGIGLNNIRNRLYVFNGNMEINSAPGEGCKLSVEFSL